jgi:hypothetical protein
MKQFKPIFITGCAKTGTTLVRRLFNAFNLKVYNLDEIGLSYFLNSGYDVGKRSFDSIFSNKLPQSQIDSQLKLIKNVNIINVTRNKKDVLKSDNGLVKESRYDACMDQAKNYSSYIDYAIKYENLIQSPDTIQNEISNKFNLEVLHKWSEYPSFVNLEEEKKHTHKGIYKLRPIGEPK